MNYEINIYPVLIIPTVLKRENVREEREKKTGEEREGRRACGRETRKGRGKDS